MFEVEERYSISSLISRTEIVERTVERAHHELSQLQTLSSSSSHAEAVFLALSPALLEARSMHQRLLFQLAVLNQAADQAETSISIDIEDSEETEGRTNARAKHVGDPDEGIEEDTDTSTTSTLESEHRCKQSIVVESNPSFGNGDGNGICRLRRRGAIKRKRVPPHPPVVLSLQELARTVVYNAAPSLDLTPEERQWIRFVAPETTHCLGESESVDGLYNASIDANVICVPRGDEQENSYTGPRESQGGSCRTVQCSDMSTATCSSADTVSPVADQALLVPVDNILARPSIPLMCATLPNSSAYNRVKVEESKSSGYLQTESSHDVQSSSCHVLPSEALHSLVADSSDDEYMRTNNPQLLKALSICAAVACVALYCLQRR